MRWITKLKGLLIPLFAILLMEGLKQLGVPVAHPALVGMLAMVYAVFVGSMLDGIAATAVILIYLLYLILTQYTFLVPSPFGAFPQMMVVLFALPLVTLMVSILKYRLESHVRKLGELNRVKTEFMSLASHQLRTPLAITKWYAELLRSQDGEQLTQRQRGYLTTIEESNERMIELVRTLLDASRMELGELDLDLTPVQLSEIIAEVLDELSSRIAAKSLVITKTPETQPVSLTVNKRLLHIIVENLVSNAVQYTPAQGKIILESRVQNSHMLLRVTDTGCGIPAIDQPHVFTKFFRASNVRDKEPDGNGLGLYLVKALLNKIDGKIWFESQENHGSTFYVSFPLVWRTRAHS